jgi:hypothetical protein
MKTVFEREVPPVFYKYFTVEDWLPLLLSGASLKFASRATFNDPFDSRAKYKYDAETAHAKKMMRKVTRNMKPAAGLLERARIRNRTKHPRTLDTLNISNILDTTGILCLSTQWDNLLLWSHYAGMHTGICVGFHSDVDVFRVAFPVRYEEEFPLIHRPADSNETMMQKTFLTKARCWEYENEWRVIKRNSAYDDKRVPMYTECDAEDHRLLNEHNGPGFYQFDQRAIESITLGMHISDEHENRAWSAVSEASLDVPVHRIKKIDGAYKVKRVPARRPSKPA